MMKKILIFCFTLFISLNVSSQKIQGYVTDQGTGEKLENIVVEVISESDQTKRKATTTDHNGFYELTDILTGISDHLDFAGDKMTITYSGSHIEINITSEQDIHGGKIYSVDGRTLAEISFQQVGLNKYQAFIAIPGSPGQALLFHDGIHPAQKLITGILPSYSVETIDLTQRSGSNNSMKRLKASNLENFIFRVDDDETIDKYQPLEITKSVDLENMNYINFEMEQWPEQQTAVIRGRIRDPTTGQLGTTADIIISNSQFNYNDTLFSQPNLSIWTDTVPVNDNGITEYNMKIIPSVQEGNIPCYTEEKKIELEPEQTTNIDNLLRALEQQQKIKGKVIYADNKNLATHIDLIIKDMEGNTVDSTTTMDGYYEFGPYPIGFEGTLDAHIRNNHPNRADTLYFGHKGIPIVPRETFISQGYSPNGGAVVMEDKVTNFEDSVKTYNIAMTPAFWTDAETGMIAKVNPAHIYKLDGNNDWDMPILAFGETNVYFKNTTTDKQWLFEMAQRINNNFGIPFVVNEVENELPDNGINITSLDQDYLNSIKNQMGINAEVYPGTSGLTSIKGTDDLEDVNVHSTTNIRIDSPVEETINANVVNSGYRELVHRMLNATNIPEEYYKSIGNSSMPIGLDTTKMVYDHINYSLIHNNRQLRTKSDKKERTGTGAFTIRPNNNEDYYSKKNNYELYEEDRFKAWDTTNIPDYNEKFFE